MEKKYTKEQILGFNESDWEFERSSGYTGYRNINVCSSEYDAWIFCSEHSERSILKDKCQEDYDLLDRFQKIKDRETNLDEVIKQILNEKYFI